MVLYFSANVFYLTNCFSDNPPFLIPTKTKRASGKICNKAMQCHSFRIHSHHHKDVFKRYESILTYEMIHVLLNSWIGAGHIDHQIQKWWLFRNRTGFPFYLLSLQLFNPYREYMITHITKIPKKVRFIFIDSVSFLLFVCYRSCLVSSFVPSRFFSKQ